MSEVNNTGAGDSKSRLKWDILLVLGMILFAALALSIMLLTRSEGGTVVVTVSGEEYVRLSLDKDSQTPIETSLGYNLLIVEGGKAYIKEASCPDKICVNHRKICYSGETVVCLPNEVTVKIIKKGGEQIDAVS